MSTHDAIVVSNLGKKLPRYHSERARTFKEALLSGLKAVRPAEYFWALREVSFRVPRGSTLGIIGPNGAGKSTLLRLISGVGRPDEGHIEVDGKVGALLDLGLGFHPELTGRENVLTSGVIHGFTRREVDERMDSIVAFAELESFIDHPLRTYSTGMQMRLAFAVAAHVNPDILLIDEALAVGDLSFQQKCLARIDQLKARGATVVLVSHDAGSVRELCDEVLWLRKGRQVAYGPAKFIVEQYAEQMKSETRRRTPARPPAPTSMGTELRVNENRFGSLEMEIIGVRLLDPDGLPVVELDAGDPLGVEISTFAREPIESPIVSVTISREDGTVCCDTSTEAAGVTLPTAEGSGQIVLHLERLDLASGTYYVDVGLFESQWAYAYDYHWRAYPLPVLGPGGHGGVLRPPLRWQVGEQTTARAYGGSLGSQGDAVVRGRT